MNYTLTDIYAKYKEEIGIKRDLYGTLYKIYGGKKNIDSYTKEMYFYLRSMHILEGLSKGILPGKSKDFYKSVLNCCIDDFWREYHNQFDFSWDLIDTDTGVICFITGTQFNLHTTVNLTESCAISECERVLGKIFIELYWRKVSRIISLNNMDEIKSLACHVINNTKLSFVVRVFQ